jgi:hypothetical protein
MIPSMGIDGCADIWGDICTYSITNNIAAGMITYGFAVHGHNCGEESTQTVFRGNLAHSTGLNGATVFPDPNQAS